MNETKKYSYKDWWNGDVIHQDATLYYINGAELTLVNWSDFNESDVERIKAKQLELFKLAVDAKFKELQAQFTDRYNNSEMKKLYLLDEIKECMNILTVKIPDNKYVHFNIWGGIHENQYITDVQYYFKRNVKSGIDDGLGFVHSPNCKFQNFSKPDPRVYGRFVWEYYKWLVSFQLKLGKDVEKDLKEGNKKPGENSTNKFSSIFNSDKAYNLFIELKNSTVKKRTQVADYAFIFHKMKSRGLINVDTKHRTFINILNTEFNADIAVIQLPFKDQEAKKVLFDALIKIYDL
jgi:hypothetical protein